MKRENKIESIVNDLDIKFITNLAYSKEICIKHTIIILLFLEPSIVFHCDIWLCDFVTVICDTMLTPNPKFQDRK